MAIILSSLLLTLHNMDEPAKRYATFVNNINTIADAWGRNEKHNEDLWSTQEWVTEWHARISEDLYKSCTLQKWKLAEEVLNPNKNPFPDIYNPLFVSSTDRFSLLQHDFSPQSVYQADALSVLSLPSSDWRASLSLAHSHFRPSNGCHSLW